MRLSCFAHFWTHSMHTHAIYNRPSVILTPNNNVIVLVRFCKEVVKIWPHQLYPLFSRRAVICKTKIKGIVLVTCLCQETVVITVGLPYWHYSKSCNSFISDLQFWLPTLNFHCKYWLYRSTILVQCASLHMPGAHCANNPICEIIFSYKVDVKWTASPSRFSTRNTDTIVPTHQKVCNQYQGQGNACLLLVG